MYEVKVISSFSAAHHLLNYEGACENQHGHNWKVEVFAKGEVLDKANILIDFKILKRELNKILDILDHKDINELPQFKNISPSSEIISQFIYNELRKVFPQVSKVAVWENENSCSTYFEERN
jgi:6-pyruvoyltetrahydropterin/6-carboxytetrahydropterin synthase